MPKRKTSNSSTNIVVRNKHHLIPSAVGGGIVYLFSGAVLLALVVAVGVGVANVIGHRMLKK